MPNRTLSLPWPAAGLVRLVPLGGAVVELSVLVPVCAGAVVDVVALAGGGDGGAKYVWYIYSTRNDRPIAIKTLRSIR